MILLAAEHFVRAPQWQWYILLYFFFAGLAGGSYTLATIFRATGDARDEAAARIGFYVAFVATLPCPIFLTVDLGASWSRFWHMLVNVTPGQEGLNFKYWSPMSVGAWALLVFGALVTVSAVEAFFLDRRARQSSAARVAPLGGVLGRAFNIAGAIAGLFIASYTGVLLSVSNQPVWSDTWALGGLFLASGLSGSAALIALLMRYRAEASYSHARLRVADGYFSGLELILLVVFFATVAVAGSAGQTLAWAPLWVLALVGIAASLAGARGRSHVQPAGGAAVIAPALTDTGVVSALVLLGVLALRAAVIFSAQ